MSRMKKAAPAPSAHILQPVFDDRPLMGFLKTKYVPFSFVAKRALRKLTIENVRLVVQALKDPGSAHGSAGVQDLDVHFVMMLVEGQNVLHVGGSRLAKRPGDQVMKEIGLAEIREVLSPMSRVTGRIFGETQYKKLKIQYEIYERVLRECERCTTLAEARSRAGVSEEEWPRLKAYIGRFSLLQDVVYAKPMLLDGELVREIRLRYLGQRVEDVVNNYVRAGLANDPVL